MPRMTGSIYKRAGVLYMKRVGVLKKFFMVERVCAN